MSDPKVFKADVGGGTQNFQCTCGREVTLWFNGGELDAKTCQCGRRYSFVARQYDILVAE